MPEYFPTPFPFHDIMKKSRKIRKLNLEDSIRANICSLVLMRMGEFAYDRKMGFEMWDFDRQVFYHEREPYYEKKKTKKGPLENATARKHFKDSLKRLISENEIRLNVSSVFFGFEKVSGNMSVYQRKIIIEVHGQIKSTGKRLDPPLKMSILYTPFQVETN
ncbi:MAG: hypothetical protein KDD15_12520 [Lewinella sp.]|nr:hypothetical protein [Lewinella sp.]